MPDTTYTAPILISADMLATLSGAPMQQGNPGDPDLGIILPGVTALGDSGTLLRLVWYQNTNSTDTEFANGQFWRVEVYDPALDPDGDPATGDDGWSVLPGFAELVPQPDLAANLGAGDEYVVFSNQESGGHVLFDINGGLPQSPTTLTYLESEQIGDPDRGDNDGNLDFSDTRDLTICFATGTAIATPDGPRPVETLRPGDLVSTRDHGAQPVLWIGHRWLSGAELARRSWLRPVRIKAGALGPGTPARDLVVSPQHRMMLTPGDGGASVLVAAIHLTALPGVTQVRARRGICYWHLLLPAHAVISANGAPAETLLPGPMAIGALAPPDREAILTLLPQLRRPIPGQSLASARPIPTPARARQLVAQLHPRAARGAGPVRGRGRGPCAPQPA